MAGIDPISWLARLTSREVLRAYQVRRVAHADKYLVRRRYFTDKRITEHSGTGPDADEGMERPIGSWTDLEAERRRLNAEGWELSPP